MRSSRNNSRSYGPSHRDEDHNYGNGNSGYSDRYIYQRDFEDYNEPYENQSYGRNSDDYDRGYSSQNDNYNRGRYENEYNRGQGNYSRGRHMNGGHNQWNEGYDRNYGVGNTSGRYNREDREDDDRNIFQRTGDRIRETWNHWTHRDEDGRHDNDRGYDRRDSRENYGRDYNNSRTSWNDNYNNQSDRYSPRGNDGYRNDEGSDRIHWGNNSNYSNGRSSQSYNNNRSQGQGSQSRPRHDYSYGHSGSIRWNSNDDNDRYYNGMTSGRSSSVRRSRELQEDYPY